MTCKLEAGCIELALEGERLCKSGNCLEGVKYFEAAVKFGTDDLKTLSAIYSQLGNAYFYLQEYGNAMEYHSHDLTLARTIGDKLGEAKASGNLGNTLKVLGKFEEAIVCCERHLEISRELNDQIGEARALYNLGNVYHAKGKHSGRSRQHDPGDFPPDVKSCLERAAHYYEENLAIVRSLGDRAAQGRACGNLGNTYYLLGIFVSAIKYHEERLSIAREFGDKSAERRACSNLGNAHVFLGDFETAADNYKKTLQIARQLGDRAIEAQACYSLGNTYTLIRDYQSAVEYHLKHLSIAQELVDRVGEGRAYWSIGNAYTAQHKYEQAIEYANKHWKVSQEIGDRNGEMTASMNIRELEAALGGGEGSYLQESQPVTYQMDDSVTQIHPTTTPTTTYFTDGCDTVSSEQARSKGDNNTVLTANTNGARPKTTTTTQSGQGQVHRSNYTADKKGPKKPSLRNKLKKQPLSRRDSPEDAVDDSLFDMISKCQSNRMEEQRCALRPLDNQQDVESGMSPSKDELMDRIARFQSNRLNEQRAAMPFLPGLNISKNNENIVGHLVNNRDQANGSMHDDDTFIEMLIKCQASRIEDQRTALPELTDRAPTVPDEDFFALIQRIQSGRMDEQRSLLPPPTGPPVQPSVAPVSGATGGGQPKKGSLKKKK